MRKAEIIRTELVAVGKVPLGEDVFSHLGS